MLKDALGELRRRGCLLLTPETLYGREFAALLQQLALKIENAGAARRSAGRERAGAEGMHIGENLTKAAF